MDNELGITVDLSALADATGDEDICSGCARPLPPGTARYAMPDRVLCLDCAAHERRPPAPRPATSTLIELAVVIAIITVLT